TFTLYLPATYMPPRAARKSTSESVAAATNRITQALEKSAQAVPAGTMANGHAAGAVPPIEPEPDHTRNEVGDHRDDIRAGDRILLIVENELSFARFLLDTAREKGYKGLVTSLGASALALTREYKPDAITLDIYLPDIEGWRVLERLKNDVATRHIPVCVISTDDSRDRALASGALAFVAKPIQSADLLDGLFAYLAGYLGRARKSLLVVEPDPERRRRVLECLDAEDVEIAAVPDGPAALEVLGRQRVDCAVLSPQASDLADGLVHQGGNGVLGRLPVIVYGDEASAADEGDWKRLGELCTVRRVQSPDRLLDLATFFLHRPVTQLPEARRQTLLDLHQSDKLL